MGDFTAALNNFSGGKVSKRFTGRFDVPFYSNSLEELKNFNIGKIGGAFKRLGSIYFDEITNSELNSSTIIPFDTGRGTPYLVILENEILNSSNIHIRVKSIESTPVNFTNGSGIFSRLDTWLYAGTFSSGQWVYQQVGDLLFVTHTSGEQRPFVLSRDDEASLYSSSTFFIDFVDGYGFAGSLNDGLKRPYLPTNTTPQVLEYKTSGTISGSPEIISSGAFFLGGTLNSRLSGALIRINDGVNESIYKVGFIFSAGRAAAAVLAGPTSAKSATTNWSVSAWNDEYGWPTSLAFHNQRLFWGGNVKYYDTVWASLTGNLFHLMSSRLVQDASSDLSGLNFFGDVTASDPFDFRTASAYANATTWLSGGRRLMIGTTGGENVVVANSFDELDIQENSNYGSDTGLSVKAGKDIIFVGKDGRSLRTYRFSDENGSWVSDDLSSKAEDVFFDGFVGSGSRPKINSMAWNPETKQLWVVLEDNSVYYLTYDPEYGLVGWTEFELGGTGDKVQSVCCAPSEDRSTFHTYLVIARKNNAGDVTRNFIEYLGDEFKGVTFNSYQQTKIEDFPVYLDSALLMTANSSGEVTYLALYEGRTVTTISFNSAGFNIGSQVVGVSGVLTGFTENDKVLAGFPFNAELKPLPLDAGGVLGTAIADIKDISRVYLKLWRSIGFEIGSKDEMSGLDLNFEIVQYGDLTTETKEIFLTDNPDFDEPPIIRDSNPTPLNILALIMKGDSQR